MRLGFNLATLLAALFILTTANLRSEPVTVRLASEGTAHYPVVISADTDEQVRGLAVEFTNMLRRITGASFELVMSTSSAEGIVLASPGDFRDLPSDLMFSGEDPLEREEHRIRTHAKGVWIAGASPRAVAHAVWGLLDRLGYRLYFLTDTWEIVPEIADLEIAYDFFDNPDFHTRSAPRGSPWSNRVLWKRWRDRNRISPAFTVATGHAYGGIIRHNRKEFEKHPEYYGLVDGERKSSKFCISNPNLRQMIVGYAVGVFKDNPDRESISMEPSDGGGWCQCDRCAALGEPSDRALLLANEVAAAINELGMGPKFVGLYGYNQHSPPPTIDAHPNVVVSLATSFIRGGFTLNEMIEGWSSHKTVLGIRDYHDVFSWSHDMPLKARGGSTGYLAEKIPYFYQQGARYMNSENADSWGANGLGYWLTPRLLWRVSEAEKTDMLIEDFLSNCFGPAAAPMREFYHLINIERPRVTTEHLVGSMYRHLDAARKLAAGNAAIMARLDDLALYTRFCELYFAYRQARGAKRQDGYEAIWRHAYRMRDRYMMSTVSICHRGKFRDSSIEVPPEADWTVPEKDNPWKSSAPFTSEEIGGIVRNGIESNQLVKLGFEMIEFSEDLVPAAPLVKVEDTFAQRPISPRGRGLRKFLLWHDKPRSLRLEITGGLIVKYRDRGNVKLKLFADQEATLEPVSTDESVPPDGETRVVELSSPYAGVHTLEVSDGGDSTAVVIPEGIPLTIASGGSDKPRLAGRWFLYCYVPRGTEIVGGYASVANGRLRDGAGNIVFNFDDLKGAGYFSVPVPEGQDGKFWRFENCGGSRLLMTIPPYLADHPSRLLLPKEVVAEDSL